MSGFWASSGVGERVGRATLGKVVRRVKRVFAVSPKNILYDTKLGPNDMMEDN